MRTLASVLCNTLWCKANMTSVKENLGIPAQMVKKKKIKKKR